MRSRNISRRADSRLKSRSHPEQMPSVLRTQIPLSSRRGDGGGSTKSGEAPTVTAKKSVEASNSTNKNLLLQACKLKTSFHLKIIHQRADVVVQFFFCKRARMGRSISRQITSPSTEGKGRKPPRPKNRFVEIKLATKAGQKPWVIMGAVA